MNWLIFAIVCWVMFAFEWGFDALRLGETDIAPMLPIVLLVVVALRAPTRHAMVAAAVIGLLYDIMMQVNIAGGGEAVVLGPHALGCMLGVYAVLLSRSLMYRRGVLAIVVTAILVAMLMNVVATVLLAVRSTYDVIEPGRAVVQLGRGLGSALYTGAAAIVVGSVLLALRRVFQFSEPARSGYRG
ncbi:MAG: hypothetical protein KDA20_11470 [Phycisphaerales bacterium]|nr:hypothetical protein [Phycisphaerales bacterium]